MGRALIALLALGLAVSTLRAESLSISLALPQRQDASPTLADGDLPRPLHGLGNDFACPVILRNESSGPLRLAAGDSHAVEPGVSFRLTLDDGRVVPIRWKPPFTLNSFSLHPKIRYWLLQPGESLVLAAHLGNGRWDWDPGKYSGHRGILIPIFDQQASLPVPPLFWSGHVEGKGVPVQL